MRNVRNVAQRMISSPSEGIPRRRRGRGGRRKHAGDRAVERYEWTRIDLPPDIACKISRKEREEREEREERKGRGGGTELSRKEAFLYRALNTYPVKWRRGAAGRPPGRPTTSTISPARPGCTPHRPWRTTNEAREVLLMKVATKTRSL